MHSDPHHTPIMPLHRDEPAPMQDAATLPNYDLHNHTVYCGHAEPSATVANLLARAREIGLEHLGISEHLMDLCDLPALRALEIDIRESSSAQLPVLFGVEMDVDPTDPEGQWICPEFECDYVILSAHGFPQFDLDIPQTDRLLAPEFQRRRLAMKWLDWYGKAIQRGGCHILGHPLREPINMGILSLYDPELFQRTIEILQPAIDQQIAFELNNAFLSYLSTSPQFAGYIQLIRMLRDRGMKFSRGSDSHGAGKLGACDGIGETAEAAELTLCDFYQPLLP